MLLSTGVLVRQQDNAAARYKLPHVGSMLLKSF
jgi:hypothetical protein